jgi:hypothetical protein
MSEIDVKEHFGCCPVCGGNDGCANAGSRHIFYCKEHKIKWIYGADIFSSWRDQTEEEQEKIYNDIGLGDFQQAE